MKLQAGITAAAVGCGLLALACEQSPTASFPGVKASQQAACISVSGETDEVFTAPCTGGVLFAGPVSGDLIGNTESCVSFGFTAGKATSFVATRTIDDVSGAFAGLSFEGTQEGMTVLMPDGTFRVTGHFTIESGARRGTLAMNGSVDFPFAQFAYSGAICPL